MTDNLESKLNGRAQILIVDDEEYMRNTYRKIIQTRFPEKYDLHFAENGKRAVEILKKYNFHLVMSDMLMPEMDGLGLYEWAKKNVSPRPQFIFVSGSIDEDLSKYFDKEGVHYLPKPFKVEEYLFLIENSFTGTPPK